MEHYIPSWWVEDLPSPEQSTFTQLRRRFARSSTPRIQFAHTSGLEVVSKAYLRAYDCEVCKIGRVPCQSDFVYPQDLATSANDTDCAGCLMLRGILFTCMQSQTIESTVDEQVAKNQPFEVKDCGKTIKFRNNVSFSVYAMPDSPSPWDLPSLPKNIKPTSGKESYLRAVDRTRAWLSKCTTASHPLCKNNVSVLPTRVVEISKGFQGFRMRIVDGKGRIAPYLCLSHFRGRNDFLKTTTHTLQSYKKDLTCEEVPPTFQHALYFTWKLGYNYLWIDSLCIIQDDINDWRVEGSRMAEIYSNAVLTIAAAASDSAFQGCFDPDVKPSSVVYSYPDPEGVIRSVCVNRDIDHSEWVYGHLPLHKRGWTLQERLLSQRVVHFIEDEVIWECRTGTYCQCGTIKRDNHLLRLNMFARTLKSSRKSQAKLWRLVVEEYTRRRLSYQMDIFPALKGIAKQFAINIGSQYLAGLWQDTIEDLLWRCTSPGRPMRWRAPTWSWASVSGSVQWVLPRTTGYKALASYCDNMLVPIGSDAFGEIASGELQLKGLLLPNTLKIVHDDEFNATFVGRGYKEGDVTVWLDAELVSGLFWLLPLASAKGRGRTRLHGLLMRENYPVPKLLERVGLFEFRCSDAALAAYLEGPEEELFIA